MSYLLRAPTLIPAPKRSFRCRRSELAQHGCRGPGNLGIRIVEAANADLFQHRIVVDFGDKLK